MKKYLILDNIRSAYNVGAIFRTADGAGVSKIFLLGYTPAPTDRFGRTQAEIKKTSLGASETLPWEKLETGTELLKRLHAEEIYTVAVEQTKQSISLIEFKEPEKVAYILGNEIDGVDQQLLEQVDTIVDIPMLGQKESLNVSVTAGVVLYHGLTTKK